MNDLHPLGVHDARASIETVHPDFLLSELKRAQQKTVAVCAELRAAIRPGITEDEGRKLALELFADHGVEKHWHRPYLRFGPGTMLSFRDPIQPDYRLKEGDPFYLDLGPVWPGEGLEYEGDYGDTYVLGEHPKAARCIDVAHQLFDEARQFWKAKRATGPEIYEFLSTGARRAGYELLETIDGHRISDFTHMKYSKERLAKVPFSPSEALWVLEVQIVDRAGGFGAFYEDLL